MSNLCDPDINMIFFPGCKTPEPSVRQMVHHWYSAHGMGSQQSKMFTDQYISEQDDICRAALDAMLAKAREDALREAAQIAIDYGEQQYSANVANHPQYADDAQEDGQEIACQILDLIPTAEGEA